MNKRMKYFVTMMLLLLFSTTLCTACGETATDGEIGKWGDTDQEGENNESSNSNTESTKKEMVSLQEWKEEILVELEAAKNGKYENLNITCEDVRLPQSEEIQSVKFSVYKFTKKMSLQEKLDFYKDIIFPKVYDLETVGLENVVNLESVKRRVSGERYYTQDYTYLKEHMEDIEATGQEVIIGYFNGEKYQLMETIPEGVCMNMSFGTLGTMFQSASPFVVGDWEVVETYDCYVDDLSDSYLLMDGEKTVAEAKAEIEAWLNAHFPLVGENGIQNEIYQISVEKIPDTEYHVFHAWRTLAYNGIPVRPEPRYGLLPSEIGVMGEAYLCESDKVDTFMGFVNCFDQGSVIEEQEEFLSFAEILRSVSQSLTEDTMFDIRYIGMEYRMFTEEIDGVTYYNWIPYWCFRAENTKDDREIEFYINMKTGERG